MLDDPDPLDPHKVRSRDDFLRFVRALIADRVAAVEAENRSPSAGYGPDAGGWENTSIEHFLESALGWAEDTNFGESQGLAASAEPSWESFAAFLLCGKIYE